MRHASLDVPHRAVSIFLLQLALSLFGQIEVFLDHLGRFIGEILYVGFGPESSRTDDQASGIFCLYELSTRVATSL